MLIFPVLLEGPGGYRVHKLALSRGGEPLDHAVHLVVVPRPCQPKYPEGSSQHKLDEQQVAAQGAGQDVEEEELEVILVD